VSTDPYPFPTSAKIGGIKADSPETAREAVLAAFKPHISPEVGITLPLSKVIYETSGPQAGTYTAKPTIPAGAHTTRLLAAWVTGQMNWSTFSLSAPISETNKREHQVLCKVEWDETIEYGDTLQGTITKWTREWAEHRFESLRITAESQLTTEKVTPEQTQALQGCGPGDCSMQIPAPAGQGTMDGSGSGNSGSSPPGIPHGGSL
jgi:hypothetical protein